MDNKCDTLEHSYTVMLSTQTFIMFVIILGIEKQDNMFVWGYAFNNGTVGFNPNVHSRVCKKHCFCFLWINFFQALRAARMVDI